MVYNISENCAHIAGHLLLLDYAVSVFIVYHREGATERYTWHIVLTTSCLTITIFLNSNNS